MATDIILRSVKAAALTHAEMDQNWESLAQTVDPVTSNYTVLVTDQNKILEVNIPSGTITLPTLANAAGTDTDSFRLVIKNTDAANLTIDADGSETIEGALSISIRVNEAIELSLAADVSEWKVIRYYSTSLIGLVATAVELNYSSGVTSPLQTQLNNKQPLDADLTAIAALSNADSNFIVGNGSAWVAEAGATARSSMGVDPSGTDNSTNVSLAGTPDYITIVGQVITRVLISLTTHITGILALANGGTGSSTAAGARTNLNVDAAGTDNSTNVSLAGTPNYITIAGQVITRNQVDLAADVTGALPYGSMTFSNNIVAGDIAPNAVGSSEIATDAVGQDEIAADAVGQAELKTVTQIDTLTAVGTQRTMTGGRFTLWASLVQNTTAAYTGKSSIGTGNSTSAQSDQNMIRNQTQVSVSTMWFGGDDGVSTVSTDYEFEYVTASKPYDLGDGEIPLFIFAEIDNSSNQIIGVSIAEDPPWAYNGNTNIRPDCYRKRNGVLVPYKNTLDIDICLSDCLDSEANMERYLDFMKDPKYREIEITQSIKNADMPVIPHNLIAADPDYMKGKSVVLIDPVSKLSETLLVMHSIGESPGKLFIDKHIIVSNEKLNRCGSECNHIVGIKWANHHAR
jgi:hypothetical protein